VQIGALHVPLEGGRRLSVALDLRAPFLMICFSCVFAPENKPNMRPKMGQLCNISAPQTNWTAAIETRTDAITIATATATAGEQFLHWFD